MKAHHSAKKAAPNNVWSILAIVSLSSMATISCLKKRPASYARPDSVDIPQTPIRDQHEIGYCWAYATVALIESNYKIKTGENLDLSEEAIGYFHMRSELEQTANRYRAGELTLDNAVAVLDGKGLEGWFVRASDNSPTKDSMELIDSYGLVPETVWSEKFPTRADVTKLKSSMTEPFRNLLTSSEPISTAAIDRVLTADGGFKSTPPAYFYMDGTKYSATTFAKQKLGFRSSDYVVLQAHSAADSRKIISATKRAMAAGFSVPVSFGVASANLHQGFFKADDFQIGDLDAKPELASSVIKLNGSHAVVATDFVNRGGKEGAISSEELKAEVAKSADELSYLKFKNSWGANTTVNENGVVVTSGEDGYYRMDYAYIKAVSALGRFGVVVPRKFAY